MTLQQLRYLREVVRHNLNITEAAKALFTSQPGVSKQLRLLEEELGIEIFDRDYGRITALSKPGKTIFTIAERMLNDADSLKKVAGEFSTEVSGNLVVATTHTLARYTLPEVLKRFATRCPNVAVQLRQGNTRDVAQWVASGDADIAVATDALNFFEGLVVIPCHSWGRVVITPKKHPLVQVKQLTLEAIARYPMIAYDHGFAARQMVAQAFKDQGLTLNIVLSALDADVIKACVAMDLGVAILSKRAFDPKRDRTLCALDASHLFDASTTFVAVRGHTFVRRYMYDFVETFSPRLDRRTIDEAMAE